MEDIDVAARLLPVAEIAALRCFITEYAPGLATAADAVFSSQCQVAIFPSAITIVIQEMSVDRDDDLPLVMKPKTPRVEPFAHSCR